MKDLSNLANLNTNNLLSLADTQRVAHALVAEFGEYNAICFLERLQQDTASNDLDCFCERLLHLIGASYLEAKGEVSEGDALRNRLRTYLTFDHAVNGIQ